MKLFNSTYKISYYVTNKKGYRFLRDSRKIYKSANEVLKSLPKYKDLGRVTRYLTCDPLKPFEWEDEEAIKPYLERLAKLENN